MTVSISKKQEREAREARSREFIQEKEAAKQSTQLLQEAEALDEQARQKRVQAGGLIYKAGLGRLNRKECNEWGVTDGAHSELLVGMYLSDVGTKNHVPGKRRPSEKVRGNAF